MFLETIDEAPGSLNVGTRFIIVQDGMEYQASPQLLSELLAEQFGFLKGTSGSEPKRSTITSGVTAFSPIVDYVSGYASYYVRLTSSLVVTMPSIPTDKFDADVAIYIDVRQDGTGGRNITFNGVADWYNVDPYNTSTPASLQVNKAANSFSVFTFRLVNGFWFGSYNKAL